MKDLLTSGLLRYLLLRLSLTSRWTDASSTIVALLHATSTVIAAEATIFTSRLTGATSLVQFASIVGCVAHEEEHGCEDQAEGDRLDLVRQVHVFVIH